MLKKLSILLVSSTIIFSTHAQNIIDAVRYSFNPLQGSARMEAMGGAFGALGADPSANQINPAGYGQYSSSVIGLTGNYNIVNSHGIYDNNDLLTKKGNFKTPNISAIFTSDISKGNKGFLYQQFGFSYNRIGNFTVDKRFQGRNAISLIDNFALAGQGLEPNYLPPFTTLLAWNTYAIDLIDINNPTGGYQANLMEGDVMNQQRTIHTKGGMGDFSINYSLNYLNKLFFGLNLAVRNINYKEEYEHFEKTDPTSIALIDSFNYSYALQTKGAGFNLKLGVIYTPIRELRLGLSYHMNTFYSLKDKWTADMVTYRQDGIFTIPTEYQPFGDYKYRYRTPGKLIASVATTLFEKAAIDMDIELVNYKGNKYSSTSDIMYDPEPNNYLYQNQEIKDNLKTVVNIRLGGEMVFARKFFVRAGFAYYAQPYKKIVNLSNKDNFVYSAGVGVKLGGFNIDLTYKYQSNQYDYFAYAQSMATFKESNNYVVASFSYRF